MNLDCSLFFRHRLFNDFVQNRVLLLFFASFSGNHLLMPIPSAVLASGGCSLSAGLATSELYDLSMGQWTTTGNLDNGRYGFQMVLLPDGKGRTQRPCLLLQISSEDVAVA